MTVAAAGLFVAVWRSWGATAFRGFARSGSVAVVAGGVSASLGRVLAAVLDPQGLVAGAAVAVLVTVIVVTLCAVAIWIGDRESAQLVLSRLPWRARRVLARGGPAK
jgi:hypothetical protein